MASMLRPVRFETRPICSVWGTWFQDILWSRLQSQVNLWAQRGCWPGTGGAWRSSLAQYAIPDSANLSDNRDYRWKSSMLCPACKTPVPPSARQCPSCGTPAPVDDRTEILQSQNLPEEEP